MAKDLLETLQNQEARNPLARSPIYTTFREGELEQALKALALKTGVVANVPNAWDVKRRSPLHIRWHECTVTYPDGMSGTCRYTRQGPKWHIFRFEHGDGTHIKRVELPLAYHGEELGRDAASIEAMVQEKATLAFSYAIRQEQQEAKRAQPPWTGYGKRKADPKLSTLSRERAIQLAGRYALCKCLEPSGKLLAVSATFETLALANATWKEQGNPALVVAIACRWARRWTPLRFNDACEH